MKYSRLDRLPAGKTKKKGKILRLVEGLDGVLVLDAFMDGQYFGRYAQVIETGEYAAKRQNEKLWHTWRIDAFLNERKYEYWMGKPEGWRFENAKQQKKVQELVKTASYYGNPASTEGIISTISDNEYHYNSEKRSRAYDRKAERVNELMAAVPDVPEDFEKWWLDTCEGVKNEEYVFYDKEKDIYHCTACGQNHSIKGAKHRQDYICKRSGKRTTVIRRQKSIRHDDYAVVISPVNSEWSVERLFKMAVVYNDLGKFVYPEETIRVMLSRTGKKTKIYYSQSFRDCYGYECSRCDSDWWDTNPANKRWNSAYLYPPKQEDLTGTQAKKLHLGQMAASGACLNWNGIIYHAPRTACFEYVLKMGLIRLAKEAGEKLRIYPQGWEDTGLNLKGTDAEEILGVDKQRINRLRQMNGGLNALGWLKAECSTQKKVTDRALLLAEQKNIKADYYTFIMDRMSPEQVINYVAAQKEKRSSKSDYYISSDWKDYLAMAQRLHMNVYDSIVYKPKDLGIRHDMLVEEIARRGDDAWICEIAEKFPDVENICREIKEKYEYANKDYVMVVPQDIKDIVNDGRVLHHCAASSERYFDRINKRECFLLFVRKKATPDEPWYTVEIQPGGTIRQKRTRFNRQDDEEEVVKFLREWQKAIKKRLTREDMELEEQSSIQREIEQMELLQKGDEKSLRVWQELEDDFMENNTVAPAHPVMAAG